MGRNPSAVPMGVAEMFTSMQQGVVDGQENPLEWIESNKYNEVQKYVVETGHVLSWLAAKTGFPSLVLAAAALVLSIRLAKKLGRVALEFALALVVLLALQKLGVMHW